VETERIELSSAGCKPAVLPLNDVPMVAEVGIEPDLMAAYETAVCTSSSSPLQNWSTEQESNLRPSVYQADAQPAVLSAGGAPCKSRTRFSALQEGASSAMPAGHKNLEPAERIERSSVAYHATALPLSYTGWSRRADSNRHLSVTRALFFPLNYFDASHRTPWSE
jgi:hypothetical protein